VAHHKDAIKRIRTSRAANARNRADRSRLRSQVKDLRTVIATGNADNAATALPETVSELHKMVKKGVIHKRNAARRISRLAKAVNALKK
jgi:small subunit ribosomal protein S20